MKASTTVEELPFLTTVAFLPGSFGNDGVFSNFRDATLSEGLFLVISQLPNPHNPREVPSQPKRGNASTAYVSV